MIISITVTYQPDISVLEKQLNSIRDQVQRIFIIDNGSAEHILDNLSILCKNAGAILYALGRNTGIAHAQNVGIQAARNAEATMLLLLDQDSEALPGMVLALHQALQENPRAAAAGPSTIDQRTGRRFFFVCDTGWWPTHWKPSNSSNTGLIEVGFLIASGTLLRSTAVDRAEPMAAAWFIDHIDTEWCLRIRAQGWTLLGVPNARLSHMLGDKVTQIWFLRWRQVAHHSPQRDFYMFRNSILLTQKPYVSWRWKLYILARLVLHAGFFLAFAPQRPLRLKMITQGIFDGLRGHTGPWK
jgi:rhamnosyltransferase